MTITEDERVAIVAVLDYGERFGYGNLISHLQTGWARRLMAGGLSEKSARLAAGGQGYPFALQDDLIARGEWDETGARYQLTPARARQARKRHD